MSTVSDTSPVKESAGKPGAEGQKRGLSALSQRLLVSSGMILIGTAAIVAGGWIVTLLIVIILGAAAGEYWRLYKSGGYHPSFFVLVGGAVILAVSRFAWGFEHAPLLLSFFILWSMGALVLRYPSVAQTAALDFNINLGGLVYLGWLGSYMVSLRTLPDGQYWILLALPAASLADGGAYLFGSLFGRHKIAPLISPKKSWEGYFGGVLSATLGSLGFAALWHLAAPAVLPWHGLVLGAAISILCPLGDLGESMLKRAFGVKDTSNLFPGHGGMLDRIDSWIWAAPIGYYIITLFFL